MPAGPQTDDARGVLRKMEGQLRQLETAARRAPRSYNFVVLSDHGQSTGATFRQRYGIALDQLVQRLIHPEADVQVASGSGEGLGQVHALLSEATNVGGALARGARRLVRYVDLPRPEADDPAAVARVAPAEVVVCASGNLALVYFAQRPGRLSLEAISQAFPRLLDGLVQHPGIAFLLVASEAIGPLVLGRHGRRSLNDDSVTGDDPLAAFSPQTPALLRRLAAYSNVGDIVVNSVFERETGQVAAFEELIGCHGGAGGAQTQPFVLYPAEWGEPACPIVGAEQLHQFLSQHVTKPRPGQVPVSSGGREQEASENG